MNKVLFFIDRFTLQMNNRNVHSLSLSYFSIHFNLFYSVFNLLVLVLHYYIKAVPLVKLVMGPEIISRIIQFVVFVVILRLCFAVSGFKFFHFQSSLVVC